MHKKIIDKYKDRKEMSTPLLIPAYNKADALRITAHKYKKTCDICDERKKCVLHLQSYDVDASVFVFLCDSCLEYILNIEKEAEHYTSSEETLTDSFDESDSETDIIYVANYIE